MLSANPMLRHTFLSAPAASAWAAQSARDFRSSTAPDAVPEWEVPLFNLPAHSRAPVVAERLELLKNGKTGFEGPCPWEEMSETQRVADALSIPIAFGECDSSLWKFDHMIRSRALDIVQPDLNYNGGFIRTARVARMAARAGSSITPHNTQTGAAVCNIVQFASAIPNIGPYMEFPFRGQHSDESWSAPHFRIERGALQVPDTPGLGVAIDADSLARAQVIAKAGA